MCRRTGRNNFVNREGPLPLPICCSFLGRPGRREGADASCQDDATCTALRLFSSLPIRARKVIEALRGLDNVTMQVQFWVCHRVGDGG
jgi:hypothetical protein